MMESLLTKISIGHVSEISVPRNGLSRRPRERLRLACLAHFAKFQDADVPRRLNTAAIHGSFANPLPAAQTPSSSSPIMTALVVLQGAALVGAVVTGVLARQRRRNLEETNEKLRRIAAELRRQREESNEAAFIAHQRTALEKSLEAPSAAHPTERYGSLRTSLARAKRHIDHAIRDGKAAVGRRGSAEDAEQMLQRLDEAAQLAQDIKDPMSQRNLARVKARALRRVGDLRGSLSELERALALDVGVEVNGDDNADVLGEMGDVLAELGDLEGAGRCYDMILQRFRQQNPN